MPRIKGSKLNPKTGRFERPADGGAIQAPPAETVRQPIKDMFSPGSDDSFESSLPASTASPEGEVLSPAKKPRKAYTKRNVEAEIDPLMSDPLYKSAIEDMTGFGGPDLIEFACSASGKPMDDTEERKVKGLFYVAGKRSNIDPGQSWIALIIYALAVFARLILARTDIGEQIKSFFDSLKAPAPAKEEPKEAKAEEMAAV